MGLWDDLFKRVKETGDVLKEEAGKAATRQAVEGFKKKASAALDDFASAAEKELEEAQAARGGRPEPTLPGTAMDDDVDAMIHGAAELEASHRAARRPPPPPPPPPPHSALQEIDRVSRRPTLAEQRQAREDRARVELEKIKARMAAGGGSGGSGTGANGPDGDAPADGPAPKKRTL